jgi:streptogramin lyase
VRAALLLAAALWLATPPAYASPVAGRVAALPWPALSHPFAFAPAAADQVFVLEDLEQRVLVGRPGEAARELAAVRRPLALARDPDGLLHVVDVLASGALGLRTYRSGSTLGAVPLQGEMLPRKPVSAAARDGILWLVERDPPRLFLYAYDGASLGWVDLAEVARAPFGVALGAAGEAFVTDPMGPAVLSFTPAGEYLGPVDLEGTGVTRPTGIAVDPGGRVWVSDGVIGHVVALDPVGKHSQLEERGQPVRFRSPLRLAWWAGSLWVLESDRGRVRIVELE